MTQRKGEWTARQNERDFPFKVELAIPPGGPGKKLDLILRFHGERRIESQRGLYERCDDQDCVRRCFVSRGDAEEFERSFGGKLI